MKKVVSLLLVITMLLSLAACSKEQPSGTNSNPSPTVAPKPDYDPNTPDSMLSFITTTGETACEDTEAAAEALLEKLGDSYEAYSANKTEVTAFFEEMQTRSSELYTAFQACSLDYFKCVAAQGLEDYGTWNDAMEAFYDAWDDTMGDCYDVWDEAYGDVYDLCDDLVSGASDTLDYDDYSNVWSAMYKEYSDAWSAMYKAYSDAWSKTYQDYSDCWGGFYKGNADVDAILAAAAEKRNQSGAEKDNSESSAPDDGSQADADKQTSQLEPTENVPEESTEDTATAEGIDPEFKAAMDSYEKFFDEYVTFMKAYKESDDIAGMANEYTAMMMQYLETMAALQEIDEGTLSNEEALYYAEVMLRINQKLLQVT